MNAAPPDGRLARGRFCSHTVVRLATGTEFVQYYRNCLKSEFAKLI